MFKGSATQTMLLLPLYPYLVLLVLQGRADMQEELKSLGALLACWRAVLAVQRAGGGPHAHAVRQQLAQVQQEHQSLFNAAPSITFVTICLGSTKDLVFTATPSPWKRSIKITNKKFAIMQPSCWCRAQGSSPSLRSAPCP